MDTSSIFDLPTPALILDLDKLERNITHMAARAERLGVALRPHIKTHKCLEIARLQRRAGARGITVSTLTEAALFAESGFDDLTWAFPVPLGRIGEARRLAESVDLGLVVDCAETVEALEASRHPFHVWLKVDCGYHRAGVDPGSPLALELARGLFGSPTLHFSGILTHAGHSYAARSRNELQRIAAEERDVMTRFAAKLKENGNRPPAVSIGSTPTMAVAEDLEGITEIRPGNYVFYDYTQTVLGSCRVDDCAVTVLSSVVSSRPSTDQAVIDAGALALSKDTGPAHGPQATMGRIFDDYEAANVSSELRVLSLSQEHGILSRAIPVGSTVRILPNHSCLTAAQFDEYAVARGEQVVDRWKVLRRRS